MTSLHSQTASALTPALDAHSIRQRYTKALDTALVQRLYSCSRLPSLLVLVSGVLCIGLVWSEHNSSTLGALLVWLVLLAGLRLWKKARFEAAPLEKQANTTWRYYFFLGATASGCTVATLLTLLVPQAEASSQTLVYGLLCASAITSSVVYAASIHAFCLFALPAILFPSLYFLLDFGTTQWGVLGLTLFAALILCAWHVNRVATKNLLNRFEKQSLIEHLQQSKRELAHELAQRTEAEKQLREAQSVLEELVNQRTRELGASEKARLEEESRRRYIANHDQLTGLANRTLLIQRLEEACRRVRQLGRNLALFHVDLDRFRLLNDSFGHEVADDVLREMAQRLSGCMREADTIARLSVDEFAVLLEGRFTSSDLEQLAIRILGHIRHTLKIGDSEFLMSASIGITLLPENTPSPEIGALVSQAGIAMQRAKQLGGNGYQFYNQELHSCTRERLLLEAQLDKALERGQLEVFYQPKLYLAHDQWLGAEALVRWRHPQFGLVSPASFIGLAEETGQILMIGEFVLRETCRQIMAWTHEGLPSLTVSVNISMHQLRRGDFVELVASILHETGLPAAQLELELTETQLTDDIGSLAEIFHQLRALGIRLAIDDFGTGYSSLSYLKHLPVDTLKIDRAFIRDFDGSGQDRDSAIVRAIIVMAHSLGLEVVAEGVEEPAQLNFLRENGCDEIQGYLISRPLPATQLAGLLRESTACTAAI